MGVNQCYQVLAELTDSKADSKEENVLTQPCGLALHLFEGRQRRRQ